MQKTQIYAQKCRLCCFTEWSSVSVFWVLWALWMSCCISWPSVASLTTSSLLLRLRTVCTAKTSTQAAAPSRQNMPRFVPSWFEFFFKKLFLFAAMHWASQAHICLCLWSTWVDAVVNILPFVVVVVMSRACMWRQMPQRWRAHLSGLSFQIISLPFSSLYCNSPYHHRHTVCK